MKSREKFVTASSNYYNYASSVTAKESFLYLNSTGKFTYEPGYSMERNSFDSFLLEIILDGNAVIETENESYLARKNDVVLLDCYQWHRYHSETGWQALWVHFDGIAARGYYDLIRRTNGNVFHVSDTKQFQKHLAMIYTMFDGSEALNEPKIALELTAALTLMTEKVETTAQPRSTTPQMDDVLYYINEHLDEELSIKQLAGLVNLSEYYFIRAFNRAMGMTPRQYIISVRMNYAKYLLTTTAYSVQEIGYMVGYASESMFCTIFKKIQKITPTEYRTKGLVASKTDA